MFGAHLSLNSLDPVHEQEENVGDAPHQASFAVASILTELMKRKAEAIFLKLMNYCFQLAFVTFTKSGTQSNVSEKKKYLPSEWPGWFGVGTLLW